MRNVISVFFIFNLWSCAKYNFKSQSENVSGDNASLAHPVGPIEIPAPLPPSPAEPIVTDPPGYKFAPLAWEMKVQGSAAWSKIIYRVIREEESQMLGQNVADDVEAFCPKYRSLNDDQRLNFWGQLFVAIAKFESGWKPTARMVETTMGKDPVTGRQVASEGFLQLSYQDDRSYGGICGFDWAKDKNMGDTDVRKTIFDPYLNLRCGIKIMARQLKNKRAITLKSGVYWAVIKLDGKFQQISGIAAMTKTLPFCK